LIFLRELQAVIQWMTACAFFVEDDTPQG